MAKTDPYTIPPINWSEAPLRHVEFWALRSAGAASELATRYAMHQRTATGSVLSDAQAKRVRRAWYEGWRGERSRYENRYNWMQPLRDAYRAGREKRREIENALGDAAENLS